jgi:hypothetical protein
VSASECELGELHGQFVGRWFSKWCHVSKMARMSVGSVWSVWRVPRNRHTGSKASRACKSTGMQQVAHGDQHV